MRFKRVIFVLLFFVIGCLNQPGSQIPDHVQALKNLTVYSADVQPSNDIQLHRETVYDDSVSVGWFQNNANSVGWFAGLEIDNEGRIYIADISSGISIHVFDADGKYLKSLGRKGSGPGEFSSIADIKIINDQLHVYDTRQMKINIWSLDTISFSRTINIKSGTFNQDEEEELVGWFPRRKILLDDSTFIAGFMKHPRDSRTQAPTYNLGKNRIRKYYHIDYKGQIRSDKLFEQRGPKDLIATVDGHHLYNFFPLPFLGQSLLAISEDQYIFTGWNESFAIKVFDPNGDYLHAFYYPLPKKKLHRKNLVNRYGEDEQPMHSLVKHGDLPETWPILKLMIADDENQLWVSIIQNNRDLNQWWVLDKSGNLLARFTWPRERIIESVKNGNVYVRQTDEETGLQQVVRYRIEMEPS